jgi:Ca2+:H+ antiporter
MADRQIDNAWWTIAAPLFGVAAVGALGFQAISAVFLPVVIGFVLLVGACVFAAVHHAEIIAARTGEPYGSIVLALAVTVLEVGLILSLMLSKADGGPTIARDTVYSGIMIIITGIVGLSLMFGSRRHFEQSLRIRGTSSALAVLIVLAVITLVLPNYTIATAGPTFSNMQLIMVALTSLLLYCVFLFVQTVRHREYFLPEAEFKDDQIKPATRTLWVSAVMLCAALFAVIMLAKALSPLLGNAIDYAGLPVSFTGVVIAGLVLLPEGIAAVRAALANRLQVSINLALGSGLATIGLTIPAVALVDLTSDFNIVLGVSPAQMILLLLALFVSAITLGNGRTNILFGAVHLSIFSMFLLISAVP